MVIILPYIIKDKGVFLISNDFVAQEIPINILANRSIKAGEIIWNWKIDLGSEFVSAMGFYLLGSPFFYLSLLFKPEAFPYVVGWILMLKYAFATLIAYIYLERYISRKSAIVASLLYAFSGFQATNTVFYHFHEVVAFFPLLLIGLDKLMLEKKRGFFLFAVFINCFLNYYFFIAEAIFSIIYYLIRFSNNNDNINSKEFIKGIFICLTEAIIGILMSGILLYPQLMNVFNNPRANNLISIQKGLFYKPLDYLFYFRSLFIPADNMYEMPIIYLDKWTSFTLYLPLFSCSLVLAYIFKKQRTWLKDMLILLFFLSFVPILNNIFVLFNAEVVHRWFFMFILMMSLASGKVLDNLNEYKWKLFSFITAIVVFIIMLIIYLTPIPIFHFNRFLFLTFTGILGPLSTYFLLSLKNNERIKKYWYETIILSVCIFSIITTLYVIRTYRRTYSFNTNMTMQESYKELMYSGEGLEDSLPYRYSFWEYYKNRSMINNIPTRSSFLSTVSPSIIKMYDNFGIGRFSNTSPGGPDGTNELFSIKYYIRPDNEWVGNIYKTFSNGYYDIYVYEADESLPIGFTYDNYITMSEFMKIKKPQRGFAMFKSLVIPDEKEAEVKEYLAHYDKKKNGDFIKENVNKDLLKHKEECSKEFTYDTHGFTSFIETKEETYAFFSVPYDKEWKAIENNEEREILDINGLMAIRLDKGINNIEFNYQANRLKTGIIISVLGIILLIVYMGSIKNKEASVKMYKKAIGFINKNIFTKGSSIFIAFLIAAMSMNLLAFLLPNEPIHKHVENASELFAYEESFPTVLHDYRSTIYDNNTDAWMLLLAEYEGDESLLQKSLMGYYSLYTLEPSGLIGSKNIPYVNGGERLTTNFYPRYWHGWIFPLRLLLQFFDYKDIRAINYFVTLSLIVSIIYLMSKNKISKAIIPFTIGLLTIVPATTSLCMSYFEITFIILVSIILILSKTNTIEKKLGFPLFFMIIGLCIGYFDFLTYPILSLGLPMVFVLLLENVEKIRINESLVVFVIKCSVMWAIGYIGMWSMKWIIASLFTDFNVIGDAINQIKIRMSHHLNSEDEKISSFMAIKNNLGVYFKATYILFFVGGIISSVIYAFKNRYIIDNDKRTIERIICLFLLVMYPIVWWGLMANHSYLHAHFTSKSIFLVVISGLLLIQEIINYFLYKKELK